MEVTNHFINKLLAQIYDGQLQLGGLFNGFRINENEYKDVIKAFKDLDLNNESKINWDKISESIEDCDGIALSYFKTLDKGNGVIDKQSASVEGLGAYLKTTGQMFDFAKIKAMAMNAVLNMGISLLVSTGISLLVKGIDNLIHAEEKAIEAGEEAQSNIKSLNESYKEQSSTTKELAARYDELSSGVDESGKNVRLSNDDYEEFLDISNQLVEIYPELLDHYDSAGNAILNLGKNSESAAEQLEALLEQERRMANYDIEQELPDVFEGVEASVKQHERTIEQYQKQVNEYTKLANTTFDLSNSINGDGFHFSINSVDEMANEYFDTIEEALNQAGIGQDRYSLSRGNILFDANGENIAEDYLNVWGLSDPEIKSVQKALEGQFEKLSGSASRAFSDFQKKITTEQNLIKQQYSNLGSNISSWITTTDEFVILSDDMQVAIQSALNNLDYSKINFNSLEELKNYIIDNFVTVFSQVKYDNIDITPYKQNLEDEYQKIQDWGLGDYAEQIKNGTIQSVFGNVDMDKRTIITWSDELKKTYQNELASWDYNPEVGSVDTVFGGSDRFGEDLNGVGWEVAFTPILPDGTLLSKDAVYNYINTILTEAYADDGKITEDELTAIDAQGRQVGNTFIQGIFAGIDDSQNYDNNGNWAETVGRLMHFSGKFGAVNIAKQSIEDAMNQPSIAIDELFSLDKTNMSVDEYRNKVNSLVEQIVGSGDEYEEARINFRVAFGFTAVDEKDRYERLTEDTMLHDIKEQTGIPFDDLSQELNVGDIHLAYNIVMSGEFKGSSIEELKSAIQAKALEAAMSIEALTTSYNKMNTEISAATSALSEQTTGQSIALDTYNELIKTNADYADALEYVNGSMQLNADKVKEITKAKAEETIATNEAAKAQNQMDYLANAKEIETLTQKLKAKNFTGEETAETVQAQIDAFKAENDTIISTCKQIDLMNTSLRQSIGTYQAWKDAQNAPQSGDMFDDALTAMDDIWDIWDEESENFMKVGNDTYKTAVEFLIPDTVDHEDMEAVKEYMRSIKKYLTWDDDGNQDGLDLGEFIQASVDEGLMYLDETSNQYMVAGQKTMEDFATGLGLSLPFVQAIFGELEEYGAEFDWGDEVYQNIGDAVVAADEQIQSLRDSLEYLEEQKAAGVKIDDSYILELQEQLKEAIMLRDDLCEEATTKVTSNIEIKEQLSQAREELASWQSQLEQDPTNVEIQAHVDESQEKVKSLEQDLETIGEPTTVEINVAKENIDKEIEETQTKIDQLSDKEYLAKIGISEEHADYSIGKLQEKLDELETEKGKIVAVYGDTSEAQTDIDNINEETIDDKEFDINANIELAQAGINQVKNALNTIRDKTVTITTQYSPGYYSGYLNGTANLSGTAHAGGDWGTKTGGTALVGELG